MNQPNHQQEWATDHGEIRDIVETLRQEVGCNAPPIPVEAVAKAAGSRIYQVPESLLCGTKGLCHGDQILVGDQARRWVRRFTIAHEVGHQVLGSTATERLCNVFAAHLLMPDDDVQDALGRCGVKTPLSLECWAQEEIERRLLSHLTHRYDVGYNAMIWALADYGWVQGVAKWTAVAYGVNLYETYERIYRALGANSARSDGEMSPGGSWLEDPPF